MDRLTENKIVLIVRQTRLDELIARFNTEEQARFYVEHLGADFSDYRAEHVRYERAVRGAEQELARLGRLQVLDRAFVPNFIFGPEDLVVVLGQDGLVANVLKYLDQQIVVGVNPDPERFEGVLLPFDIEALGPAVREVFAGRRSVRQITMARADLNTGEALYGVNDLFIGPKSHVSARYELAVGEKRERHSSSGVIVSTGLGSTGWLRSIVTGATGISAAFAGRRARRPDPAFEWDADHLCFSVREPWPSRTSTAELTFGHVTVGQPLELISQMPEHGVIFSDGIEADFLRFNSGTRATISVAAKKGHLAV